MINHFFKNKKILVTGHTGFKGSWLTHLLKMLNAEVIGFALEPPKSPNLFTLTHANKDIIHVIGDIRDYNSIFNTIKQYQPEIVIHMAAQPLVLYSYDQPIETYATNVLGTVNLLEAIRQVNVTDTIINITTDKCYQNNEFNIPFTESNELGGFDPYSNSKACSELVTSTFRNAYFNKLNIGLASARAGNVIGGGDWAENRLIPDIIQSCINNKPLHIRNPKAIRPWQHVLDALFGYLCLTKHLYENPLTFAEPWNFGPNDHDVKPVAWICDYIINKWGGSTHWIADCNDQLHEATHLRLDCSKAKKRLNWQPQWEINTALSKTIEWFKAFENRENMHDITLHQINSYLKEVATKSHNHETVS